MNDNAKKWIAALRSGEYQQGKGKLKFINNDGVAFYCCLGVACELAAKEGVVLEHPSRDIKKDYKVKGFSGLSDLDPINSLTLPKSVMEWMGVRTDAGEHSTGLGINTLTVLNDEDVPFDTIADLIESNPTGLFKE